MMKHLRLTLAGIGIFVLFQNCAPANVSSGTVYSSSALSSTLDATSAAYASITLMYASYSPALVTLSDAVTITVKGGLAPYTYEINSGAGKLAGNVYTPGPNQEVVTITATDSIGSRAAVLFPVTNGSVPSLKATAEITSNATQTVLPNTTVVPRTCSLLSIYMNTNSGDLESAARSGISYESCLMLSRTASSSEVNAAYKRIINGDTSPQRLLSEFFGSAEAKQLYGWTTMSFYDFTTFMYRVTIYRDPTDSERSSWSTNTTLNLIGSADTTARRQAMFDIFIYSKQFYAGQPYIAALVDMYNKTF